MFERLAGQIRHALRIRNSHRALDQLERSWNRAQETGNAPELHTTIAAARDRADQLEDHHRARALVIAYQARRALAELNRTQPQAQPEPPEPTADLAAQLKELAALHQAGALTDTEFEQAKQKLLH